MEPPATRAASIAFTVAVVVLVALHLWPPHGGPQPMVLGFVPWDLAWHLLWMAAAGAAVFAMTSTRLWPDAPADHDEVR